MNILFWLFQVLVAWLCVVGAVWRFMNADQFAKIASSEILPLAVWTVLGLFEIACSLALILPPILKMKPKVVPIAATCLSVELLLVTAVHVHAFGFQFRPTNPAAWSISLAILAGVVAFGRFKVKPFKDRK